MIGDTSGDAFAADHRQREPGGKRRSTGRKKQGAMMVSHGRMRETRNVHGGVSAPCRRHLSNNTRAV